MVMHVVRAILGDRGIVASRRVLHVPSQRFAHTGASIWLWLIPTSSCCRDDVYTLNPSQMRFAQDQQVHGRRPLYGQVNRKRSVISQFAGRTGPDAKPPRRGPSASSNTRSDNSARIAPQILIDVEIRIQLRGRGLPPTTASKNPIYLYIHIDASLLRQCG